MRPTPIRSRRLLASISDYKLDYEANYAAGYETF